jgi:hypothetical protein
MVLALVANGSLDDGGEPGGALAALSRVVEWCAVSLDAAEPTERLSARGGRL